MLNMVFSATAKHIHYIEKRVNLLVVYMTIMLHRGLAYVKRSHTRTTAKTTKQKIYSVQIATLHITVCINKSQVLIRTECLCCNNNTTLNLQNNLLDNLYNGITWMVHINIYLHTVQSARHKQTSEHGYNIWSTCHGVLFVYWNTGKLGVVIECSWCSKAT